MAQDIILSEDINANIPSIQLNDNSGDQFQCNPSFMTIKAIEVPNAPTTISGLELKTQKNSIINNQSLVQYSLPTTAPLDNQVLAGNGTANLVWETLAASGILTVSSNDNNIVPSVTGSNLNINLSPTIALINDTATVKIYNAASALRTDLGCSSCQFTDVDSNLLINANAMTCNETANNAPTQILTTAVKAQFFRSIVSN